MASLAEMLGYIVQPLGGPGIPALAKSPTNVSAGSPMAPFQLKGPPESSPAEMMAALNAIANAQYENELNKAKAEQARATAKLFGTATELGGYTPTMGGGEAATPAAAPGFGNLGGGAPAVAAGPTSFSPIPDKSNFASGLRKLTELGVDPEVAAGAVHYMDRNENGYNPLAINPTSGAAFRAQWLGPRKAAIVGQYGDRPSDPQQAEFMGSELLGPERRTLNALLSAKSAKEGYDIWGTHYERPGAAALAKAGVGGALRGRPTNQIEQQFAGGPVSYTEVPSAALTSGGGMRSAGTRQASQENLRNFPSLVNWGPAGSWVAGEPDLTAALAATSASGRPGTGGEPTPPIANIPPPRSGINAPQMAQADAGGGIVVDGQRYASPRAWRQAVDAMEATDGGRRFLPQSQQATAVAPGAPVAVTPLASDAVGPQSVPPTGAPMSLAPPPGSSIPSYPRYSPQDLAVARRMENIFPLIGKTVPTWAREATEMAPGGSKSVEYLTALEASKAWATVAPNLFSETQKKMLQAGLDLNRDEKAEIQKRITNKQNEEMKDFLKNRSEGRLPDPANPNGFIAAPGYNQVTAGTKTATTTAEEEAKVATTNARLNLEATLRDESKRLEQLRDASLTPVTGGIRIGDREFPVTRQQYADITSGRTGVPGGAGLQAGGALQLGRDVPAEEMRSGQTKARIAVDTKAAEEVGAQATLARRLMPLIDEVVRHADTTPQGWAGPVAASAARGFSAFGIPVAPGLTNAELLESVSRQLIPLVREPGATSEKELANYLKAVPGLMQSAEGRKKIAGMIKSVMQGSIDIADVYRENIGSPDLKEKLGKLSDERKAKIDREVGGGGANYDWDPATGTLKLRK